MGLFWSLGRQYVGRIEPNFSGFAGRNPDLMQTTLEELNALIIRIAAVRGAILVAQD
jgi:hypothetical protein